jgi:hypothetical protein
MLALVTSGGWAPRRGRRLRIVLAPVIAGTGITVVAVLGTVIAITGGSLDCLGGGATIAGPAGPPPSDTAVAAIPAARLRLYELAGRRFDIDWSFLASIGTQECNNDGCQGDNGYGCAGPMQIAERPNTPCSPAPGPTLWDRFQVSAFGGTPDINDPADAIFTAAHILRDDMGAPATGGSYEGYYQAACRYYGACADAAANYASEVMARAVQYGFNGAGAPAPTSLAAAQPAPDPPGNDGGCDAGSVAAGGGDPLIVAVAESQLGQTAHPPASDCTIYGPCEEWCSLFAAWVWQHARIALPGGTTPYAHSGTLYTWTQTHRGRVLPPTATPLPGDAVLYGAGPSDSVHVGIVEQVLPNGEITTIDGNLADRVVRVGPFLPGRAVQAGEPAAIYGYAQPPTSSAAGLEA